MRSKSSILFNLLLRSAFPVWWQCLSVFVFSAPIPAYSGNIPLPQDAVGAELNKEEIYKQYSKSFANTGDFQHAEEYFQKYLVRRDSFSTVSNAASFEESQRKFETEKKEKEVAALKQQSLILTGQRKILLLHGYESTIIIRGVILLAILLFVVVLLFYSRRIASSLGSKLQVEQKLLRTQMNPHFIYNALIAIQNFVHKNNPQEAARYIHGFAHLIRMIFETNGQEYVAVADELTALKYYLELQQLRFGNAFSYEIVVDPQIDIAKTVIPPMLAQPMIENAIEHGIVSKPGGGGHILIRLSRSGKQLALEISDNGIGRKKSAELKVNRIKHTSMATNITRDRLALMNRRIRHSISFSITDLTDDSGQGCGTRAAFTFFNQNISRLSFLSPLTKN